MRTYRPGMVVMVMLALLAGPGGTVIAQDEGSEPPVFPTGTFVAEDYPPATVTFDEDGTCAWVHLIHVGGESRMSCTFATNGDLFTEMTTDRPLQGAPMVPATYYWAFDGEHLTFEPWGEDLRPGRLSDYTGHTYRLVEHPVEIVVALHAIAPGQRVTPGRTYVSAGVANDAFTVPRDVRARVAAVDIAAGQPITPDLLEPLPEE